MNAKETIKKILLFLDQLFCMTIGHKKSNGVLLVRLDAIGDFIIWLETAKKYREIYPNQKITLVANKSWQALATQLKYWDDIWFVNPYQLAHKPIYRWHFLRKISKAKFNIAINPTYSRAILHDDSVIRASNAKIRIGSTGDNSNLSSSEKKISDQWYSELIPASNRQLPEMHRNAEFISGLTKNTHTISKSELPIISAPPKTSNERYFIIFPGASWIGKRWPAENFAKIITSINTTYGWQALLCGGIAEIALCNEITSMAEVSCLNLAGKTTLPELTELIRAADLLVSNDTSAIHIAAAVKTPSVCILGGGHYGRFLPYPEDFQGQAPQIAVYPMPCFQCNWHCTMEHDATGPVPCIANISVGQVMDKVSLALQQQNK